MSKPQPERKRPVPTSGIGAPPPIYPHVERIVPSESLPPAPKPKPALEMLSTRVPTELKRQVKVRAALLDIDMQDAAREAWTAWLEAHPETKAQAGSTEQ